LRLGEAFCADLIDLDGDGIAEGVNFQSQFINPHTMFVSRIVGVSLVREMGPVLTALMIGGRVGLASRPSWAR